MGQTKKVSSDYFSKASNRQLFFYFRFEVIEKKINLKSFAMEGECIAFDIYIKNVNIYITYDA